MYVTIWLAHRGDRGDRVSFRCRRTCTARWRCRPAMRSRCTWSSTEFWTRSSSGPATRSNEGQLLAQLRNIDVDIEIAELTGQRAAYEAQLEGLKRVSFDDRTASAQIEPVDEALASVERSSLPKRRTIATSCGSWRRGAGTVLPPPLVEKQGDEVDAPADLVRFAVRSREPRRHCWSRAPSSARSASRIAWKRGWSSTRTTSSSCGRASTSRSCSTNRPSTCTSARSSSVAAKR